MLRIDHALSSFKRKTAINIYRDQKYKIGYNQKTPISKTFYPEQGPLLSNPLPLLRILWDM